MNFIQHLILRFGPFLHCQATVCKHNTRMAGKVRAFGESRVIEVPVHMNGDRDYCLDCLSRMTILCAWCRKPIFIGDPIMLNAPDPEGEFLPPEAVVHNGQFVGCIRCCLRCAESGEGPDGFWMPGADGKGKVEEVKTLAETLLDTKIPPGGIRIMSLSEVIKKEAEPKVIRWNQS